MSQFERDVEEAYQGNSQAMVDLGKMYLEGDGAPFDKLKAASLFCMAVMAGQTSAKELLPKAVRGLKPEEIEKAKEYVTGFDFEEEWEGAAKSRAQELFDESIGLVDFKINHMLVQLYEEQVRHFQKLANDALEEGKKEHEITEGCSITIHLALGKYGDKFANSWKNKNIEDFDEILKAILILTGFGYRTFIARVHDNKSIISRELLPYGQVKYMLERPL